MTARTLLLCAAASVCAPRADAPGVLEFWAMWRGGEVVGELIDEFDQEHPGIRVDVQQLPWTSAHEKLLTAYAGRPTPGVSQDGSMWVPEMAALGAAARLDSFAATSPTVRRVDYFPDVWDTDVVGGRL